MRKRDKIHTTLEVQYSRKPQELSSDRMIILEQDLTSEVSNSIHNLIQKQQLSQTSSQRSPLPLYDKVNISSIRIKNRSGQSLKSNIIAENSQGELDLRAQDDNEQDYFQGRSFQLSPNFQKRNIFSTLLITSYVKKFTKQLMSYKKNQKIKLHRNQLGLINDYGACDPYILAFRNYVSLARLYSQKQQKVFTWKSKLDIKYLQLLRYVQHSRLFIVVTRLITYIPVLSPDHIVKQIWDGFIALTKIYLILLIPVEVCFHNGVIFGENYNFVTTVMCSLMVIDEIFNLNKGSFEFGSLVIHRNQQGYVKILEIFSIFILMINSLISYSIPLVIQNSFMIQLSMIFYIQFINISHYQRKFEAQLNLSKYQNSIYRVFKLIITILYVEHLVACIWYTVGVYGINQGYQKNWIQVYNFQDSSWQELYFESIYFNVVTMISVGYGDITPQNDIEKLFTIIFMLSSSIQLSYVLSTCGIIINQLTELTERTNRKIRIINSYMKRKNINKKIQEQTREYLYYFLHQQNEQEIKEESEIISQLSQKLQETLIIDSNSQILQSVDVFQKQFSPLMILALSKIMKSDIAYPEEQISLSLFKNYKGPLIFFIESGMIEEYVEGDGQQTKITVLQQHKQGEHFGLLEFFSQLNPEKKKYKSHGFTKLIILKKQDFINIIQDFPNDMERYFMIQNEILKKFSNNFNILNIPCGSCYQIDHSNISCPLIHHRTDREKIIKTYCYNTLQERSYIKRNRLKNDYNSIVDQQMLDETGQKWRQDNLAYIDKSQKDDDDNEDDQENVLDSVSNVITILPKKGKKLVPIQKRQRNYPHPQISSIIQGYESIESIMHRSITRQEFKIKDIDGAQIQNHQKIIQVGENFNEKQSQNEDLNVYDSSQSKSQNRPEISLDSLNYWYLKVRQRIKHHGNLDNNKHLKDIEITLLKLKFQLENEDPLSEQFDHLREYHIFNPHSNFSTISDRLIFNNLTQDEIQSAEKIKRSKSDVWQLSKYLLYPYQFMRKYQLKIPDKYDRNDKLQVSPSQSLMKHRLSRIMSMKRITR